MHIHLARRAVTSRLNKFAKAARAIPVDLVLVLALQLIEGVPEDFAVFSVLDGLGLREAGVKHVLVVLHEDFVVAELVVEAVLRVRQQVTLF